MKTQFLTIDPAHVTEAQLQAAAELLVVRELVAFPTETVYGLGALADDEQAAKKIYEAKGRPSHNPLITHLPTLNAVRELCGSHWNAPAQKLAERFWPGPLTLVLPRVESIAAVVCAGGPSMALRVPAHPVASALLRAVKRPIAAPSANRSNELSPTTAQHVLSGLDGRIAMVIDGGPCTVGLESTVLDLTCDPPVILRPGRITSAMLSALVSGVQPFVHRWIDDGISRASPGMERLHYAPRAKLLLVDRDRMQLAAASTEGTIGAITIGKSPAFSAVDVLCELSEDPAEFGAALFATLHKLDELKCKVILVQTLPAGEEWDAARDRLSRATQR